MPVCYRHPTRETGVSCSNCGRPICPDCMTPTSVGMRCPECAGERTKVRRMQGRGATATFARRPSLVRAVDLVRHTRPDRDQRDRVPVGGRGRSHARRRQPAVVLPVGARRAVRPVHEPRLPRVLATADLGVPAREHPAHRHEHVLAVVRRALARAGDRPSLLRRDLLHGAVRWARSGRCCAHPSRRRWVRRARSSACSAR